MKIIEVDRLAYAAIELLRAALSEASMTERLQALEFVGADQTTFILQGLDKEFQILQPDPANVDFLSWVASTGAKRADAAGEVVSLIESCEEREREE